MDTQSIKELSEYMMYRLSEYMMKYVIFGTESSEEAHKRVHLILIFVKTVQIPWLFVEGYSFRIVYF